MANKLLVTDQEGNKDEARTVDKVEGLGFSWTCLDCQHTHIHLSTNFYVFICEDCKAGPFMYQDHCDKFFSDKYI